MNAFQTILLTIFGVLAVVGTIIFSGFFSKPPTTETMKLSLWGTLPQTEMQVFFDNFNKEKLINEIRYEEHSEERFDSDLVEALANGVGPDIILITDDLLLRHENKLAVIPYSSIDERTFKDTFIDESAIFLNKDGILAIPLLVDPLVLYWNKDLFTNAGIAQAPSTWEQVLGITAKLTEKDQKGNVTRSAIALGGFSNIKHAKDIIATLLMQAGERIVWRSSDGLVQIFLESARQGIQTGGEAALRFYTEFSNPSTDEAYTWNSAIKADREAFTASSLAMYIAPFSEAKSIKDENPHLNFDIAVLPQRENGKLKAVYGRLYGLATMKSSRASSQSLRASIMLGQMSNAKLIADSINLPPARRDLISSGTKDVNLAIAYKSAIIAKSWLDPSPGATERIFKSIVDAVTSGSTREGDAIQRMSSEIGDLLPL